MLGRRAVAGLLAPYRAAGKALPHTKQRTSRPQSATRRPSACHLMATGEKLAVRQLQDSRRWKAFSTDSKEEGEDVEESIETDLSKVAVETEEELAAATGQKVEGARSEKRGRITREEMISWRLPFPDHKLLSPEAREMMYQLHKQDPDQYDFKALGEKYGVSWIRAKAICMLEKEFEERDKSDLSEAERESHELGKELEKLWYQRHGTVAHGSYTSTYAAELEGYRGALADAQERNIRARPRPLYQVVDASKAIKIVKRLETKYDPSLYENPVEKEMARLRQAAEATVPVTEMEQKSGFKPSASKRFKYVFADISKGVGGDERWVAVRDPGGSLRAANFDERFRVEKFVRPPRLPTK